MVLQGLMAASMWEHLRCFQPLTQFESKSGPGENWGGVYSVNGGAPAPHNLVFDAENSS